MRLVTRTVPRGERVVCFSDVHGHPPALEAVLARAPLADAAVVVVHGDVVNRGPCSGWVWRRLQTVADERWVVSAGNHERYVATHHVEPGRISTGVMGRVHQSSRFAYEQLGPAAAALPGLPDGVHLEAPGLRPARVVHASMAGDEAGLDPTTPDDLARARVGDPVEILVVGHVHRRLDFRVGPTRVVNAGSVGSAADGTRAAGWTELVAGRNGWEVTLHRIAYDVRATDAVYRESGFLDGAAGPVARLIHREWELARPVVRPWFAAELERVRGGEVDLDTSVARWLRDHADAAPAPGLREPGMLRVG